MKTAIIGSGISGLSAASRLYNRGHDFTLYEANDYIGGHVKTIRVPVEGENQDKTTIPIELGVFMHDPKYIHPVMNQTVRELGVKIREIPLTFSFENNKNYLSWTTQSRFSGILRDLSILFRTIKNGVVEGNLYQNVSYILELKRFFRQMPKICAEEKYCHMSLSEFIQQEEYSDSFLNNWLLPQLMCWWGATGENAMMSNIQVIMQSMYLVSISPQYVFEDGWDQFLEKFYTPFRHLIRLNSHVDKVVRKDQKVQVTSNGVTETYDNLVFAICPSAILNILQQKNLEEENILKSFKTTTTKVYLHRDQSWMPKGQEWATVNLIQDVRGDFCTLYFGALDQRKPLLLVTWGDRLIQTPDPAKIIHTADWLRTLPTVEYTKACHNIHSLQGKEGIWYCGAHVDGLDPKNQKNIPSLWHENSLRSGLYVADLIDHTSEIV